MTVPPFTFVMTYVRPEFTSAVMFGYCTQSLEFPRFGWYGHVGDSGSRRAGRLMGLQTLNQSLERPYKQRPRSFEA